MPLPSSVCIGIGEAAVWTVVVRVAAVDVTAQVIDAIRIDAEEGAARIAEFTLRPPAATVIDPASWTGRAVEIDVADNSTGTPTDAVRRFTGKIDTPTVDMIGRTVSIRATDDLQGVCDATSNAALDALIVGYPSPVIFDPDSRGWDYAQDMLSTVPRALDLSPTGTMRCTDWSAKITADLTLDEDVIGDASVVPRTADLASLINEVTVSFNYRFPRVKGENYIIDWEFVTLGTFTAHVTAAKSFLQRVQVPAALAAAGASLNAPINYAALPTYAIGSWTPTPGVDETLCMGFTADVSFDYAQQNEEQHVITVANALSIAAVGTRQATLAGSLVGDYPDITAAETQITLYKKLISGVPPVDSAPPSPGNTSAADVTLSAGTDRTAADAAMEALIAIAKTRIRGSHRHNSVRVTVPLIPDIDLDKTLRIDADGVLAQGKCIRVTEIIDPAAGSAIADVEIALSALDGVGITHDEDPTTAPAGTTPANTPLPGAPVFDFNMDYGEDRNFSITFPAVADSERDNAITVIPTAIAAAIDEDLFEVTL